MTIQTLVLAGRLGHAGSSASRRTDLSGVRAATFVLRATSACKDSALHQEADHLFNVLNRLPLTVVSSESSRDRKRILNLQF